jgi:hypothetical protein
VAQTSELNGWRIVSRALADEVTIVSSSRRPVEPCAEVTLYRPAKEPTPQPTVIRRSPSGVLGAGHRHVCRRPEACAARTPQGARPLLLLVRRRDAVRQFRALPPLVPNQSARPGERRAIAARCGSPEREEYWA